MAETQKGTSSVNRKEKNSFLDDDIGNDFLTSWKSMSATKGDDAMDFGFDTVSSGKNKTFHFEKLDMDFSLDGEFGKLSSFKVDMSDFDFSSPSKKVTKAKENSVDEASSGKPQGKNSQFNLFDFNDESVVDKVTQTDQNDSGGLTLECHKGKASKHVLCRAMSVDTNSNPSDSESPGSTYKSRETEMNVVNSNEAQTIVKSGANVVSVARELLEGDVLLVGGTNNVQHVNNHRECFTSDVLPNDCKLAGTSQLHDEEVTKKKALISTCDKDDGNQIPTGFQVSSFSLSEKPQLKSSSPPSVNPKRLLDRVESTRDTKIKSVDGNKVSLVRSPNKLTNLSLLRTSKTKGAAEKVSDSTSQRHTSSLQIPRHEMKVLYISTSETARPFESNKKKSPPNFSLKRKSYELPDSDLACLKPLKRLSSLQEKQNFQEPPRQGVEDKPSRVEETIEPFNFLPKASNIRDFEEPLTCVEVKESLRRVDGEKGTQKENHVQNNLNSIRVSVVHSPRETNVTDLELSLTIENGGSFERAEAEAYAKDLEDVCNMLRKKQEEAKEILVRALVSNNNLLMLNPPIYEEKIGKVQTLLMSKELKT